MPIYSYKCSKCGNVFEKMEKASDNGKVARCDLCNSEALRMFSPVGIIFKGPGFYSTDYKTSSTRSGSNTKNTGDTDKTKDSGERPPKTDKNTSGPENTKK